MKDRTATAWLATGTLGIGCLAVAVAGTGAALAGSHSGTIHGCAAKSDGTLRIVHSAKDCTSHEKPISFDKRGRQGPRGPRGAPGQPGQPASTGTFQMYADVDQNGDLGSNYDAVSATETNPGSSAPNYLVTFTKPIGSCAAVVQTGYAGGSDTATPSGSIVDVDGTDADTFRVVFTNGPTNFNTSAFMMIVTCAG
jgi:hypothetical protein